MVSESESSKAITNGIGVRGLGLLQKVSDTGQCASEDTEPRKRWTPCNVSARTLAPKGVDYEIPHQLEKNKCQRG